MPPIPYNDFVSAGGLASIAPGEADDLFIVGASFEPRSSAITNTFDGRSYQTTNAVLYVNEEFKDLPQTIAQLKLIADKLRLACPSFQGPTVGSWENSLTQFSSLKSALAPGGPSPEPHRITVDITTFTREALLSVLAIIRWGYPNASTRLVYVSPQDYTPPPPSPNPPPITSDSEQKTTHEWLSRGFRKMRNAIGFAGIQDPQKPSALIMLMGFEVDRAISIVDNLEPSDVYLGKAVDGTHASFLQRNTTHRAAAFSLIKSRQRVTEFNYSAQDIACTTTTLRSLIQEVSVTHNVFLTSLTTKPVLIATFLAAEGNKDVQITCSVPGEYNIDNYSNGMREVFTYNLPPPIQAQPLPQ